VHLHPGRVRRIGQLDDLPLSAAVFEIADDEKDAKRRRGRTMIGCRFQDEPAFLLILLRDRPRARLSVPTGAGRSSLCR
jgi:hypothetical protein